MREGNVFTPVCRGGGGAPPVQVLSSSCPGPVWGGGGTQAKSLYLGGGTPVQDQGADCLQRSRRRTFLILFVFNLKEHLVFVQPF